MADAGTKLNETDLAAPGVDDGALLSADVFAAALAEIDGSGPPAGNPKAPPQPGRSTSEETPRPDAVDEPPAQPAPQEAPTPAEAEAGESDARSVGEEKTPLFTIAAPRPAGSEAMPAAGASAPAPASQAPDGLVAVEAPRPAAVSRSPTVAGGAGLKFKIGKKGGGLSESLSGAAAARRADALGFPAMSPLVRLGKRLVRWAERVLDAVHRPLERISPKLLPIVGVCALTTIAVSALSIILLPILFPSRDAISFLEERVAALDAPKVEKPKAEAGGHGPEKTKQDEGDGHGESNPKKKAASSGQGDAKSKTKEDGSDHAAAAKKETTTAAAKSAPAAKSGGAKKSSAAH